MRHGSLDSASLVWDCPTLPITTADKKKRVVLSSARPGDVFDLQTQGDGTLVLVRLVPPEPKAKISRIESLRALELATHELKDAKTPRLKESKA